MSTPSFRFKEVPPLTEEEKSRYEQEHPEEAARIQQEMQEALAHEKRLESMRKWGTE